MAGGMDRMARALAAQSMGGGATGPAPANIEDVSAMDAGADLGAMPGMEDPAAMGGPDAALGEIEAALAALSPDIASKGRAHIQALRELLGGEGAPASPQPEPGITDEEV